MPDIVGQRLQTEHNGAYQVYELVAAGAFGSVYFGRDLQNNRAVAIKRLHPHWARDARAVERFNQEAQTGRELTHPNVVQLLDQGSDADGIPFIVMQWVEGWTVAALFERHVRQLGAFPIDEAVEIAWQTLAGLEAARRIGLVHRDIKPLNLMVTPPPERQVKVMDFGIAKDVLASVTGDNTQVGTLAYMSPEQFTGAAVDARTDLYALGVTLYELLAGQRPFLGPTPAAYVRQHLYERPIPLAQVRREIDAALAEVVHKALARQPEDRFQSPMEMQAALRPFNRPALELTLPAHLPDAYLIGTVQAPAPRAPSPPPELTELADSAALVPEEKRPIDGPTAAVTASVDASDSPGSAKEMAAGSAATDMTSVSTRGRAASDEEVAGGVAAGDPGGEGRRRPGWASVAVATGVVVLGVAVVAWWSPWKVVSPVAPTPTTVAAATLAPVVVVTPRPVAELATRIAGAPPAAPTLAPAVAKPTRPIALNWRILVDGLQQLNGLAVDEQGNLYVANSDNNRVQKLSAAGQPLFEWGNDWGPGPGQFETPEDVAVDAQGNIYVADKDNNRIQKLAATGEALAQWGTRGSGPGQFEGPMAVAVGPLGNTYIADTGNDRIQKLSVLGQPLAQWGTHGSGPGQFSGPTAVVLDGRGNLYVADSGNDRIQKLSATGQPLAQWGASGRGPGQFSNPTGVAVDGQGNVYVTDRANARVQKLSATGQPLAQWGTFNSGSGPGQFSNPFGVAVDAHGNVFVVDRDNRRIQELPSGN